MTPRRALDAIAVALLGVWVWRIEAGHLWAHNWLNLSWGDWVAHAYRARFFEQWGLTNWDPDWDNGLPLFQGYQTLPHVLTVLVSHALGSRLPHTMMLWEGLLLVVLPVGGYLALRGMSLGVPGALLGAALLLDMADIAAPIGDFSYMFGVALVPLLAWIVLQAIGTRKGYAGAVAIGITPYLHPYSTAVAAIFFVARAILERRRFVTLRTCLQAGVILLVSSFYWLPYALSARPRYQDPWNTSLLFEHHLLARTGLLGVDVVVVVAAAVALALLLARRLPAGRVTAFCGLAAVLTAAAALASYADLLPAVLVQVEFVRLMPAVSVVAAMAAAPLGDLLWDLARRPRVTTAQKGLALGAFGILLVAAAMEGRSWFRDALTTGGLEVTDSTTRGQPLAQWAAAHPQEPRPIVTWTTVEDLAYTSYAAFGQYHFAGDYIVTRQWTLGVPLLTAHMLLQVGEARVPLSGPEAASAEALFAQYGLDYVAQREPDGKVTLTAKGDWARTERLLRLYGVKYVFLSDFDHLGTNQYINGSLQGHLTLLEHLDGGWMSEVPWTPVTAFVAPLDSVRATTVPDLPFNTPSEAQLRDRKFDAYNALAYSPSAAPATITWQDPTHLTVKATAAPGGALVIPQNWDTVWQATADGRPLPVERVGPNFIAVRLGGLSGAVTVHVNHGAYWTWQLSALLVGLGAALAVAGSVLAGAYAPEAQRRA